MKAFSGAYIGRRVLLTGHTGFKGSWLLLWLHAMEAEVSGVALAPGTTPNHWSLLGLDVPDFRCDIRDGESLRRIFQQVQPEVVFHLAAQPLVRRSYSGPIETWSTNVMGTANVLECCRATESVQAVVAVTTDKVYENHEWPWGYRENDPLGGHDPYSASKAASEILAASYRRAFFSGPSSLLLATVRGGNVIGGGDWSEDRLIPDLVRAVDAGHPLEIRSPNATRPWQHVLDCLSGYLLLGSRLLEGRRDLAEAWNFGPDQSGNRSVAEVLQALKTRWPRLDWEVTRDPQPHEASLLYLDSAKARSRLGWRPVWGLDQSLALTARWYQAFLDSGRVDSRAQLDDFLNAARGAGEQWATA